MKNTWKLLPLALLTFLATSTPAPADPPSCQVLCATTHCTSNADCGTTEYCNTSSGACLPLLPVGSSCESDAQCQTHDCTEKVCSTLVASGAGIACAVGPAGGADGWKGGLVVALVGLAASLRRRRGQRSPRAAD